MAYSLNWWTRKLHRWGAILTAIPLLIVILSGLLLQVKKEVDWVQPPSAKGTTDIPVVDWPGILTSVSSVSEAEVSSWDDIDRVDVRPGKGICKVQCKNRWEVQLDLANGKVLATNYRRSDLIESFHDGSFFSDHAKLWVFLPNGLVLFGLWLTGAWLWWLPIGTRLKKRKRKRRQSVEKASE